MNIIQRLLAAMGDKIRQRQEEQGKAKAVEFFNGLERKYPRKELKPIEQVRQEYRDTISRMTPSNPQTIQRNTYQRPQGNYDDLIRQTFGNEASNALAIMQAESQGDFRRIGDKHLMFRDNNEDLGDSIGGFQIRTGGNEGGKVWNRAKANGMSADDFRKKMLIPEENIKYAKSIYDRYGWNPWTTYSQGTYKQYLK